MGTILRLAVLLLGASATIAAASNDAFTNRTIISGTNIFAAASFAGATIEPGEPHSFNGSLWWEWTAPTNIAMSVQASRSLDEPPAALVYTGTWPNLTLVSSPIPGYPLPIPSSSSFRAEANTTYYIALAGPTNSPTTVQLRLRPGPVNDNFASATTLAGTNQFVTGTLQGATLEPAEQPFFTNSIGTTWWKWSPGSAGRFAIFIDVHAHLVLYHGNSLTNLTLLDSASFDPALVGTRIIRDLPDDTYYIAVEDIGYQQSLYHLQIRTGPVNDDFANRTLLPPDFFQTNAVFRNATREPQEPGNLNPSLWWEWTAPHTGSFAIETTVSTSTSTPALEIFTGTFLTNLIQLAPNTTAVPPSRFHIRAQHGQTYLIRVSAPYSHSGSFYLRIRPGPINDDFANAILLPVFPALTNTTFVGATFEPGEPLPNSLSGGSTWWTFIPPATGAFSINAGYVQTWLNFPLVRAYRGDSLTNLTPIPNIYGPAAEPTSFMTLRANAGETIRVQLIDRAWEPVTATLSIRPGPPNDDFINAILITNAVTTGTNTGASSEPGEVQGQTVWYKWMPDPNQGYELRIDSHHSQFGISNALYLFEGDSFTSLHLLHRVQDPPDEQSSISHFAEAGKNYYIAVNGLTPGGGLFNIHITPGPTNDTFANRTVIESVTNPIAFTTIGATREPGEPSHENNTLPRTVWFERTADFTGTYFIEIYSNLSTPGVAIYQGDNISNLVALPTTTSFTSTANSYGRSVAFRVSHGAKYFIAIHDDRARELSFRIDDAPSHDAFADPRDVELFTPIELPISGASLEPGEPTNSFPGGTLWHRFTAPAEGSYVALADGGFPEVYRGTALTNLVLAESHPLDMPPYLFPFRASPSEPVYIRVAVTFPRTYSLRVLLAVENDDFNNRLPIVTSSVITNATWSTLEPGEPLHSTNLPAGTVWWSWTPTNSGTYRIQSTSYGETFLAVYSGTNLTNLTFVAHANNFGSQAAMIDFHAEAGVEYAIVASHLTWEAEAPFTLEIHTPPPHDTFANALELTLDNPRTNNFVTATMEPIENGPADSGTLWYYWTAPTNGTFMFLANVAPEYFGPLAGVYTGNSLTNLNTVFPVNYVSGYTNAAAFQAQAGTTYYFAPTFWRSPTERTIVASITPGHPHDHLENPAQLSGHFVAWTTSLFGATAEQPGEHNLATNTLSIWAQWFAPETGAYKVVGPSIGLEFHVFESSDFFQPIAASSFRTATFNAVAGRSYHIRLGSAYANSSQWIVRLGPAAPNELPANATELTGTNITVTGNTWTSTSTLPSQQLSGLVWWKWTAPANGHLFWQLTSNVVISSISHDQLPTFDTNIFSRENQFLYPRTPAPTQMAVSAGVTYLFGIRAAQFNQPVTNFTFSLQFEEVPVSLGSYSDAFFGGHQPWFAQTNTIYSPPDALQTGPLGRFEGSWVEMILPGPGTVRFRTKAEGPSLIRVAANPRFQGVPFDNPIYVTYSGPHDWTLRSLPLNGRTNLVRWIAGNSNTIWNPPSTNIIVWLDDIEFVPTPPRSPTLGMTLNGGTHLRLAFLLEGGRTTIVESSTNLMNWIQWSTNLTTPFNSFRAFDFPIPIDDTPQFFRARVESD